MILAYRIDSYHLDHLRLSVFGAHGENRTGASNASYIMLQLLFILYIHVPSFVQLIIWGGICRFLHVLFLCTYSTYVGQSDQYIYLVRNA